MLSLPYCLRRGAPNIRAAKICSPKGRGYSIFTLSKNPGPSYLALHRCSGARVWSPDWRRRIVGMRGLPRTAKNVHVSPTGGIVTYITQEKIVVRNYT